tara:strand:+ start:2143 stop:2355 length:213 start_codon:yes stop_codon:yes gene_type:complete
MARMSVLEYQGMRADQAVVARHKRLDKYGWKRAMAVDIATVACCFVPPLFIAAAAGKIIWDMATPGHDTY